MDIDIDKIFNNSFLNEFNEQEKKKKSLSQDDQLIISTKKPTIDLIAKFLQKFVDANIVVNHKDLYTKNTFTNQHALPQKFNFSYIDSSKKWEPGISIYFLHPAEIEIAIPNKDDEGIAVIKVITEHPDSYLLEHKHLSIESVCESLAKFLSRCTTSVGGKLKQNSNISPSKFIDSAPETPPNLPNLPLTDSFFSNTD